MKLTAILILICSMMARAEANSMYIGDPLNLLTQARSAVSKSFPDAELWLVQSYARESWDKGCSQFGWSFLFIGAQDGLRKAVRAKFDHKSTDDGCMYSMRENLEVEPDQTVGIEKLGMDRVGTSFESARQTAEAAVKVPFKVWYAKLVTPLHPKAAGRVFWNFIGPVECNKKAEITIESSTGQVEPFFSKIPVCP